MLDKKFAQVALLPRRGMHLEGEDHRQRRKVECALCNSSGHLLNILDCAEPAVKDDQNEDSASSMQREGYLSGLEFDRVAWYVCP